MIKTLNKFIRIINEVLVDGQTYSWALNFDNNELTMYSNGAMVNSLSNTAVIIINAPANAHLYAMAEDSGHLYVVGVQTILSIEYLTVWKVTFSANQEVAEFIKLDSIPLVATEGFDIKVYSNPETQYVHKLYITVMEGKTYLENAQHFVINLLDSNGAVLRNLESFYIDLAPCISTAVPYDGALHIGVYRYTYRLVRANQHYTNWAPLSNTVQIGAGIVATNPGSSSITGEEDHTSLPKSSESVNIKINVTTEEYTHIELARIYYYHSAKAPIIEIIKLIPIYEKGQYVYRDTSNYGGILQVLSVAELIVPNMYYKYAFAAFAENYMFIANLLSVVYKPVYKPTIIQYGYFAVGQTPENLYAVYSVGSIPLEGYPMENLYQPAGFGNVFTAHEIAEGYQEGLPVHKYLDNEAILTGQEGPPTLNEQGLPGASGSTCSVTFHTLSGQTIYTSSTLKPASTSTPETLRGVHNGNAYMLGVVLYSNKGQRSNVIPLGIVNVPDLDFGVDNNPLIGTDGKLRYTQMRVSLASLPLDTTRVQLVYVKRKAEDLRTFGMGIALPLNSNISTTEHRLKYPVHIYAETDVKGVAIFSPDIATGALDENLVNTAGIVVRGKYALNRTITTDISHTTAITTKIDEALDIFVTRPKTVYKQIEHTDVSFPLNANSPTALPVKTLVVAYAEGLQNGVMSDCVIAPLYAPIEEWQIHTGYYVQFTKSVVPYGGNRALAKQTQTYEPFSDVTEVTNREVTLIAYGDVYTEIAVMQTHSQMRAAENFTNNNTFASYLLFPTQSLVNSSAQFANLSNIISSKTGRYLAPTGNKLYVETVNNVKTEYKLPNYDLYSYFTPYTAIMELFSYMTDSNIVDNSTKFPVMVRNSERKFAGDFKDAYLLYKSNNFAEMKGIHAQVTQMLEFNSRIIMFQESAISMLYVNELSQVMDTSNEVIAIGKGDVLGAAGGKAYQVLFTNIGCGYNTNIIRSNSALYWLDSRNRHIYRWTGNQEAPQAISLLNGIPDIFDKIVKASTKLVGSYEGSTGNVYLTVLNYTGTGALEKSEVATVSAYNLDAKVTIRITNYTGYVPEIGDTVLMFVLNESILATVSGVEELPGVTDLQLTNVSDISILAQGVTGNMLLTSNGNDLPIKDFTVTVYTYSLAMDLLCKPEYLELTLGDTVYLSHEYPNSIWKIIDMTSEMLLVEHLYGNAIPNVATVNLLWHAKYLTSFTIVYSEIKNEFVNILSMTPVNYIHFNKMMYTVPHAETHSYTEVKLWKHDKKVRNTFYGKFYPSVLRFVMNARTTQFWHILRILADVQTTDTDNTRIDWAGSINRNFQYIRIKAHHKTTDMIKLVTQKNDMLLESYNETTGYLNTMANMQPNASVPHSFDSALDIQFLKFYNIEREDDYWQITLPRVRSESYPNVPLSYTDDPTPHGDFYEDIKSRWVEVSIYYLPENPYTKIKMYEFTETQ